MSEVAEALDALSEAKRRGVSAASEPASKALLRALGIEVPDHLVIGPGEDISNEQLAGLLPVMAKAVLEDTTHKSDFGGVAGPFRTIDEARAGARDMVERFEGPVLLERFHGGGLECFVGLTLDSPFGPLIGVGLGGLWVEVMRDTQHRRAPVDEAEVREMLDGLQAAPLFHGLRGHPAVDLDAVCAAVATISRLALRPEAAEILGEVEINPLIARRDGAPVALDCVVTFNGGRTQRKSEES